MTYAYLLIMLFVSNSNGVTTTFKQGFQENDSCQTVLQDMTAGTRNTDTSVALAKCYPVTNEVN